MSAVIKQQPISWLPASWTVCLLTIFLVVTAFINKHVPDSYMVRLAAASTQHQTDMLYPYSIMHSTLTPPKTAQTAVSQLLSNRTGMPCAL